MPLLSAIVRISLRGVVLPTVFFSVLAGLSASGVEQQDFSWSGPFSISVAHAQRNKAASCRVVRKAQALKTRQKYRQAQQMLQGCVTSQCSDSERTRCASELQKLERSIPSIVVLVTDGTGNDVTDISVSLDGETLVEALDGHAIAVDPGEHQFVFQRTGQPSVERTVKLVKGQKFRPIQIEMVSPQPEPVVASGAPASDTGRWVAGMTLGVVGLAGGVAFALAGSSAKTGETDLANCRDADRGCPQGRIDSAEARFDVANVALGVGVLSLGAAVWVLLSGDGDPGQSSADSTADKAKLRAARNFGYNWSLRPTSNGGTVQVTGTF